VWEPPPAPLQRDGGPDSWPAQPAGDSHRPDHAESVAAQVKLEQIKDLYLTAEAIGEDALVKHFDQLSERQRELIREYFEQAKLG
jgi:hypothetical protein